MARTFEDMTPEEDAALYEASGAVLDAIEEMLKGNPVIPSEAYYDAVVLYKRLLPSDE
jgi:hypothetical protein